MTLIGARGETAAEIARALHLKRATASVGAWPLGALLAEPADGEKRLTFRAPNTMWVQSGMPLEQAFLTAITDVAAAAVHDADFVHESEKARQEANLVVAEQTADKIGDLVPPGAIDVDTRMVLANAIYLTAVWAFPFPAGATTPQPFHADGDADPVTVPMMRLTAPLGYARGWLAGGDLALRQRYRGPRLAMVVLPDGPVSGMVSQFTADGGLGPLLVDVRPTRLQLSMPRFRVTAEFSLRPALERLGIVQAFDCKSADFGGITTAARLFISAVLHQACLDVDEHGTEAAAAAAVIMKTLSMLAAPQLAVTVDRPCLSRSRTP